MKDLQGSKHHSPSTTRRKLLIVRHANEVACWTKLLQSVLIFGFKNRSNRWMGNVCGDWRARSWIKRDRRNERCGRWRLVRHMQVLVFESHAVRKFLAHLIGNVAEIDEA